MVFDPFLKGQKAVLDYAFDWGKRWLQAGESIDTYTLTIDAGITNEGDSENDGIVTVWLSGGTYGETYEISCVITTNLGRTEERLAKIIMEPR
jgi:hypothetical protein